MVSARCCARKRDRAEQSRMDVRKRTGCSKDDDEAIKWYRLAAAQGNASHRIISDLCTQNGRAVPKDYDEAIKWFRLAAAQGDAAAQYNLGEMYANGRGVPQDDVRSHMWLTVGKANPKGCPQK